MMSQQIGEGRLIDADALLDKTVRRNSVWNSITNSEGKNLEEIVSEISSVTPQEPKTGCWVDDKCSVCGKGIEDLIDSSEWYRNEEPNFCPFCGARMVEPQESEDKG